MRIIIFIVLILLSFSVTAQKRKKRISQNYPIKIECVDAFDMTRMSGVRLYSNSVLIGESDSLGIINTTISNCTGKSQLMLIDSNNTRDSVKIEDYLSSLVNSYQILMYPNDSFEDLIWEKEDSIYGSVSRFEIASRKTEEISVPDFSDSSAQFMGGNNALIDYLDNRIDFSRLPQTTTKAYIRFVIEPDGRISHILCLNDVPVHFKREAIRVVRQMPNWKPGYHNGSPARTTLRLPIVFKFL